MRLVVVPRWAGDLNSDFYPWLVEEVGERFDGLRFAELLPEPGAPTIEQSVAGLTAILNDSQEPTIVLGHSVGNQVIMRSLAQRNPGCVRACLFVAGWFDIDDTWDEIVPWTREPIDLAKTRAAAGATRVLLSDDDPYTSDVDKQRAVFETQLGSQVRIVSGAKHFNGTQEPEVLADVLALLDAAAR